MADTLGSLIDKLFTIDMKMWNNQESLYEIRKMTFEQFDQQYMASLEDRKKLFSVFHKACDLNLQRNEIINEIDRKLIEIINAMKNGEELDNGKFLQRAHKTY